MTKPKELSRDAIRSLTWIILTALGGIIVLSLVGAMVQAGWIGDRTEEAFRSADEALSILGNIAAAAVGGLVGWLTRDLVVTNSKTGEQQTITPDTKMILDPEATQGSDFSEDGHA
jgi:hypothetical protein